MSTGEKIALGGVVSAGVGAHLLQTHLKKTREMREHDLWTTGYEQGLMDKQANKMIEYGAKALGFGARGGAAVAETASKVSQQASQALTRMGEEAKKSATRGYHGGRGTPGQKYLNVIGPVENRIPKAPLMPGAKAVPKPVEPKPIADVKTRYDRATNPVDNKKKGLWDSLTPNQKTGLKIGGGIAAAGGIAALAASKKNEQPTPTTPYY